MLGEQSFLSQLINFNSKLSKKQLKKIQKIKADKLTIEGVMNVSKASAGFLQYLKHHIYAAEN